MRVIRIVPVLAILTATILVASIFAFSVVGSVHASHLPEQELESITLVVTRVDIVHTTDLAVKGVVLTVLEPDLPASINFLDLQPGIFTALGNPELPTGFVTQIRIVVIDASIQFNSDICDLFIPAGVVRLNGVFSVPGDTDAVFVFDAEKSLIVKPSGFQLKSPIKFQAFQD